MKELNAFPTIKMYPLESTYLAWVDVSQLNIANIEKFFEEAGVGISAGKYFGNDQFIRINFACPLSTLEEAVFRIKKAISSISDIG